MNNIGWGQAVNNNIGFGFSSAATERVTTDNEVRLTESGELRITEDSQDESYASIYSLSWSGETDLIKNG